MVDSASRAHVGSVLKPALRFFAWASKETTSILMTWIQTLKSDPIEGFSQNVDLHPMKAPKLFFYSTFNLIEAH